MDKYSSKKLIISKKSKKRFKLAIISLINIKIRIIKIKRY